MMPDSSDSETELVSSVYGVHSNKKLAKESEPEPKPDTWSAFDQHLNFLKTKYDNLRHSVFDKHGTEVCHYIKAKYLSTVSKKKTFPKVPCALVNMANVGDVYNLIEVIVDNFKKIMPLIVRVSSAKFQSVTEFMKLTQESLSKIDQTYVPTIRSDYYSLFAKYDYSTRPLFTEDNFLKPCLVIFEDFEAMDSLLLGELFCLMQSCFHDMPVLLICFQATDLISINSRFPERSLSALTVKGFDVALPKDTIYGLLNYEDTDHLFFLGPKVASLLISYHSLWEPSLTSAYKYIELCLLEHFSSNPCAKFSLSLNQIGPFLDTLGPEEMNVIRRLPSTGRNYDTYKNVEVFRDFFIEDFTDYIEDYKITLKNLQTYHRMKEIVMHQDRLFYPSTWLVYLSSTCFTESNDFKAFRQRFKEQNLNDLTAMINVLSSDDTDLATGVTEIFIREQNKRKETNEETPKNGNLDSPRRSIRRKNTALWQSSGFNQLNALEKYTCETTDPIKKVKSDILKTIENILNDLVNPLNRSLSEMFFFDNVDVLKIEMMPPHRTNMLCQLEDCRNILDLRCPQTSLADSDIMILYHLIKKLPRVICLNNLFGGFKEYIRENSPPPRKRRAKPDEEEILVKRFVDGIRDLDHIGVIRGHPQKSSLIERLVWPKEQAEI